MPEKQKLQRNNGNRDNSKKGDFLAILFSIQKGKDIQKNTELSKKITQDFENLMTYPEIIEKHSLTTKLKITQKVARAALSYAISGYHGKQKDLHFNGLIIDKEKIEQIRKKQKKKIVENYKKNKIGMFKLTPEERSEISRRTYKKVGKQTYLEKKGVHARSKEQIIKDAKKGAIAIGYTPWKERQYFNTHSVLSEKEFAYMLSQSPLYHTKSKHYHGKTPAPDKFLIAEKLNELYHNGKKIRNYTSVSHVLSRMRKQKNINNLKN